MYNCPGDYPLFDGCLLKIRDINLCEKDHHAKSSAGYPYLLMIQKQTWTPIDASLPLLYVGSIYIEHCGCCLVYEKGDETARKQPGAIIPVSEKYTKEINPALHSTLTRMQIFPIPHMTMTPKLDAVLLRFSEGFWEYCYGYATAVVSIRDVNGLLTDTAHVHHSYIVYQLVIHLQTHLLPDLVSLVASYT